MRVEQHNQELFTYLLKVTLCWNIFLWQEKIVYFSWHFLAQKCLRINDLLFSPPYTILFSVPLCENCQWRLRVWCQRLWRPNLQKCEEHEFGQLRTEEKKRKKERKETDKSRKIVQFPRERKTSSITLLPWRSLTQLLTLDFLLIILVSNGQNLT